ncbi:GNAT family N-acetyltransferase [Adhaeribacter aquaticus]|uniref:GNAT family N-acetyltransferase n=1 Tax=Adhaeribacter aquaticus TaxID=299567 RepID=UPI00040DDE97|nr:GNAT family N-acetyltransferase [Adhaeribacter aquaticus]
MIAIRRFQEADIPRLYEAVIQSVQEIKPWLFWSHEDYSLAESQAFVKAQEEAWKEGQAYNFVITDTETEEFLGSVGLGLINRREQVANLGYWVHSNFTKSGIASTATRLAAQFGLQALGLERIEIVAATDNKASCRVAEKAGAKKECLVNKQVLANGKLTDGITYSFNKEDFMLV